MSQYSMDSESTKLHGLDKTTNTFFADQIDWQRAMTTKNPTYSGMISIDPHAVDSHRPTFISRELSTGAALDRIDLPAVLASVFLCTQDGPEHSERLYGKCSKPISHGAVAENV